MMKRFIYIMLLFLFAQNSSAQISIKFASPKRAAYHHGDTIHVAVMMRLNPQSCLEGMKKTYIYYSGCADILSAQWVKRPNNIFQKNLILKIDNGDKTKAKVTITRNTDKESLFRQELFNIK